VTDEAASLVEELLEEMEIEELSAIDDVATTCVEVEVATAVEVVDVETLSGISMQVFTSLKAAL
jgi:hypothetical protein